MGRATFRSASTFRFLYFGINVFQRLLLAVPLLLILLFCYVKREVDAC